MNRDFIFFFMLGLGLAAVVLGLAPVVTNFNKVLFDYQTLIAGVIATLAAVVTIFYLRAQTHIAERQMIEIRQRERVIAQAALPIYLSEVSRYAEDCLRVADRYWHLFTSHKTSTEDSGPEPPTCSPEVLSDLARAAGALPAPIAKDIAELMANYQVQHSRFQGMISDYRDTSPHTVHASPERYAGQMMYDSAELHLLAGAMFEAARQGLKFRGKIPIEKIEQHIRFARGRDDLPERWL